MPAHTPIRRATRRQTAGAARVPSPPKICVSVIVERVPAAMVTSELLIRLLY